jgi:hypothetical protein
MLGYEDGKQAEDIKPPAPKAGTAKEISIIETGISRGGIMLRNLEDLQRFARLAVSGGAAPKGMTEGQATIAIQAGLERGLGPLGGLQQAVVINGVLSWRGQAALALIQNSGLCRPGTLKSGCSGEGDSRIGWCVAHRVGYKEPDRREFTVKDAKVAGLWTKSGPWHDHPSRQLTWRAIGFLARDIYPDVLGGFPLAEEAEDFEPVAPQRPPILAKAEQALPAGSDPLLEALSGEKKEPEVIDVEPEAPKEDPPFASHEEADKEIALSEKGLFS